MSKGNEIRHGLKATCLSLMRLCKEQIVSEVQRSQLHYVVKSLFLSYNHHDRNQSNTAIELVAGMFIRQRLSSFHKFILSSWCIIVYHIIKYHVSSPLGALSKSQVWEVPPFVWGWTLLCTTWNFAFLIQCNNVGYYNYKLRMARWTTKIPTIWRIQIAGGRCPAHPEHPFAFP